MSDTNSQLELRAENLTLAYNDTLALRINELKAKGNVIAVIGHNGSGKSTLIKSILGLLVPRAGAVSTHRLTALRSHELVPEKHMAFSPETGAVFADINVESYVRLWCRIKQNNPDYYKTKEGSQIMERLNVPPLFSNLGRELSKGQKRRVQIAIGFLTNPQLYLFDEPFDGMDIARANDLASIMMEESEKMSMIISSHRMDVVERVADTIIVLRHGELLTAGTIDHVCRQLCGQSILLSNTNGSSKRVLDVLRKEFSKCLVHQIGSQLSITGPDISLQSLSSILYDLQLDKVTVSQTQPSLVDAMHFHLRELH